MKQQAASKLGRLAQQLRDKPEGRKFRASPATKQMIRNMVGLVDQLGQAAPTKAVVKPGAQPVPRAGRLSSANAKRA